MKPKILLAALTVNGLRFGRRRACISKWSIMYETVVAEEKLDRS